MVSLQLPGGAGGHARRHEVRRNVARRQRAIGELGHFAQRADGIDADFRPGPRSHGGEEERQHHGDHAHPPVDREDPGQQQHGENAGDDEADDEPGHGDFDVIQRALGGVAFAAKAAEDAGEGPPQGPPLEGQRQQPADHQHRGPRPERPGTDVAEAADLPQAPSSHLASACGPLSGASRRVESSRRQDSRGWSAGRESLASHVAVGLDRAMTSLRSATTQSLTAACVTFFNSIGSLTLTTPCSGLGEPSCKAGRSGRLPRRRGPG